jgi:hypothetical protein
MNRLRPRLTYANVVATLALFLVLTGGAAYAATRLAKNSVGSKQLKKNSVTGAKIKDGTITGAKINLGTLGTVPNAEHANTAGTATNATTATTASVAANAGVANNASRLGGLAAGSYQLKSEASETLFATVAPANVNAQVVRGRGAVSLAREGTGFYKVKFDRNVTGCTWEATYGAPGNEAVEALWATVRGVGGSDEVGVVLWSATTKELTDGKGFTVAVFCP